MSEQPHPTCMFHPLLSVYYLVRERMERERLYGHRIFASSQLSVDIQRGEKGRMADVPGTPDTESVQPVPVVGSDDVSSRPHSDLIDLVTSFMTISEVVSCLTAQGCENLTNQLDLGSCSQYPISNGGFGDIYQGKLTCGTPIALKTMRVYVDTDTENRKRFKHAAKELYTWSKCQHRNVQRLLGLTEFRGQIAMVSVWEVNGNLSEYLRVREDVDRCQLSAQVAEGLAYLHESNIVHGDLKSSNVLVSKEGVPLLADFGNATLQGCTLNFTSTSTKSSVSMRWAAPELLDGTEMRSAPADVYALGMVSFSSKRPAKV
ncbi:hypothetical protein FRC08_016224 [Ceratobasidium sp. 394]|nr:hypothetical protein FRC08_016224 [Ceratobasidium sp. 394]